jgi:hypothetical protein
VTHPRPTMRGKIRYDWWRAHHGLPQHAKWRSVAREAGVPVSVAFHIAVCLLDLASRSNPRGSIAEFKPFDCAGIVDVPLADVERVLVVLRTIHWIEGYMLADWDERQPMREDDGAARRKAEQRARGHTTSHNVTQSKRDTPQSHTPEAGHEPKPGNVTSISAPDTDKRITTTTSVAASSEENPTNPAGLLATAHPTGALARPPDTATVAPKQVSRLTRAEFDAHFHRKTYIDLKISPLCPCCVGWRSHARKSA